MEKYPNREREAQALVDKIVARMIALHYPVECTNKSGYKQDHISCATYGSWNDKPSLFGCTWFEYNLASILIGG